MHSNCIAVDLDGVILNFNWDSWVRNDMRYFGTPIKGAKRALRRLRKRGYKIIIHTCRANPILNSSYSPDELYMKIKKILIKNEIPFDEIWLGTGKPLADYYIDDRAVKFESWEQVLEEID